MEIPRDSETACFPSGEADRPLRLLPATIDAMHTILSPSVRTGLSAAESAHWHQHGWVAVPDFFDADEIAILRDEVTRLQSIGRLRNVATEGDGVTTSTRVMNLQLCPIGPHSRPIRALGYAGKVASAICSLLGPTACQAQDQVFLKPARHGAGTNWHTDNAYFKSDIVAAGTGMWIAIHDASRANGTMKIIPGSNRREFAHERDPGSDHHITCAKVIDDREAFHVEMPAGGVLFFNFGIAHATGGNRTDSDRAGLALHYVREHAMVDSPHHFLNGKHHASRRVVTGGDGGAAIFGEDLRGVWEALISSPATATATNATNAYANATTASG